MHARACVCVCWLQEGVLYLTVMRNGRVDQSKTIQSIGRLDDHRSHTAIIRRDNRRVSLSVIDCVTSASADVPLIELVVWLGGLFCCCFFFYF